MNDPVIYTRNDYRRGLRNGSLGRIVNAYPPKKGAAYACQIDFEGDLVEMTVTDLSDIELSYAITIHKSQGNQFSRVIVPLQASKLLDHSLIYTAVTRSIKQCVILGDEGVIKNVIASPPISNKRIIGLDLMLEEVLKSRQSTFCTPSAQVGPNSLIV